jgi:hypothetical protein
MDYAMLDVRESQDAIMQSGGADEWYEHCKANSMSTQTWEAATGVGSRKSSRNIKLDIHGNDPSYRAAKARLHTLAIELGELSVLERAWELEHFTASGSGSNIDKMARMRYSATNAISMFNGAVRQGTLNKVEVSSASFMRKRGRDWEVCTNPDYPSSDSEDDRYAHKSFTPNDRQRDFIARSEVPTTFHEDKQLPKRKRRRMDASVSLHPLVYVRSEADVDELRHAASSPTPKPRPASILRTSTCARDPRPRRPYYTRPLKKRDGATRPSSQWCRRYIKQGYYQPGSWTVPKDKENVDTSGSWLKNKHAKWERYVESLQEEAEDWDMEWELDEMEEEDSSSDDEESALLEIDEEELNELRDELRTEVDGEDDGDKEEAVADEPATVKVKGLKKAMKAFPQAWR